MHTLHLVYLLQAGLEVIEEGEAQLWWAGKELKETKLLSDYVGRNEKTTIIVKIQKVSITSRLLCYPVSAVQLSMVENCY